VSPLQLKETLLMKVFGTQWERMRTAVTPSTLRLGLALVSLVVMVFAGTACEHWN